MLQFNEEPGVVSADVYAGGCSCGKVQFEVSGQPVAMGYCDCESCRRWSTAPLNAFPLWKPQTLRVTRGAALIRAYIKTATSNRKWCRECGGLLYTEHASMNLVGVRAALIPQLPFESGLLGLHCPCVPVYRARSRPNVRAPSAK